MVRIGGKAEIILRDTFKRGVAALTVLAHFSTLVAPLLSLSTVPEAVAEGASRAAPVASPAGDSASSAFTSSNDKISRSNESCEDFCSKYIIDASKGSSADQSREWDISPSKATITTAGFTDSGDRASHAWGNKEDQWCADHGIITDKSGAIRPQFGPRAENGALQMPGAPQQECRYPIVYPDDTCRSVKNKLHRCKFRGSIAEGKCQALATAGEGRNWQMMLAIADSTTTAVCATACAVQTDDGGGFAEGMSTACGVAICAGGVIEMVGSAAISTNQDAILPDPAMRLLGGASGIISTVGCPATSGKAGEVLQFFKTRWGAIQINRRHGHEWYLGWKNFDPVIAAMIVMGPKFKLAMVGQHLMAKKAVAEESVGNSSVDLYLDSVTGLQIDKKTGKIWVKSYQEGTAILRHQIETWIIPVLEGDRPNDPYGLIQLAEAQCKFNNTGNRTCPSEVQLELNKLNELLGRARSYNQIYHSRPAENEKTLREQATILGYLFKDVYERMGARAAARQNKVQYYKNCLTATKVAIAIGLGVVTGGMGSMASAAVGGGKVVATGVGLAAAGTIGATLRSAESVATEACAKRIDSGCNLDDVDWSQVKVDAVTGFIEGVFAFGIEKAIHALHAIHGKYSAGDIWRLGKEQLKKFGLELKDGYVFAKNYKISISSLNKIVAKFEQKFLSKATPSVPKPVGATAAADDVATAAKGADDAAHSAPQVSKGHHSSGTQAKGHSAHDNGHGHTPSLKHAIVQEAGVKAVEAPLHVHHGMEAVAKDAVKHYSGVGIRPSIGYAENAVTKPLDGSSSPREIASAQPQNKPKSGTGSQVASFTPMEQMSTPAAQSPSRLAQPKPPRTGGREPIPVDGSNPPPGQSKSIPLTSKLEKSEPPRTQGSQESRRADKPPTQTKAELREPASKPDKAKVTAKVPTPAPAVGLPSVLVPTTAPAVAGGGSSGGSSVFGRSGKAAYAAADSEGGSYSFGTPNGGTSPKVAPPAPVVGARTKQAQAQLDEARSEAERAQTKADARITEAKIRDKIADKAEAEQRKAQKKVNEAREMVRTSGHHDSPEQKQKYKDELEGAQKVLKEKAAVATAARTRAITEAKGSIESEAEAKREAAVAKAAAKALKEAEKKDRKEAALGEKAAAAALKDAAKQEAFRKAQLEAEKTGSAVKDSRVKVKRESETAAIAAEKNSPAPSTPAPAAAPPLGKLPSPEQLAAAAKERETARVKSVEADKAAEAARLAALKSGKKPTEDPTYIEAAAKARGARSEYEQKGTVSDKQIAKAEEQKQHEVAKAAHLKSLALNTQANELEAQRDKALAQGDKKSAAALDKQAKETRAGQSAAERSAHTAEAKRDAAFDAQITREGALLDLAASKKNPKWDKPECKTLKSDFQDSYNQYCASGVTSSQDKPMVARCTNDKNLLSVCGYAKVQALKFYDPTPKGIGGKTEGSGPAVITGTQVTSAEQQAFAKAQAARTTALADRQPASAKELPSAVAKREAEASSQRSKILSTHELQAKNESEQAQKTAEAANMATEALKKKYGPKPTAAQKEEIARSNALAGSLSRSAQINQNGYLALMQKRENVDEVTKWKTTEARLRSEMEAATAKADKLKEEVNQLSAAKKAAANKAAALKPKNGAKASPEYAKAKAELLELEKKEKAKTVEQKKAMREATAIDKKNSKALVEVKKELDIETKMSDKNDLNQKVRIQDAKVEEFRRQALERGIDPDKNPEKLPPAVRKDWDEARKKSEDLHRAHGSKAPGAPEAEDPTENKEEESKAAEPAAAAAPQSEIKSEPQGAPSKPTPEECAKDPKPEGCAAQPKAAPAYTVDRTVACASAAFYAVMAGLRWKSYLDLEETHDDICASITNNMSDATEIDISALSNANPVTPTTAESKKGTAPTRAMMDLGNENAHTSTTAATPSSNSLFSQRPENISVGGLMHTFGNGIDPNRLGAVDASAIHSAAGLPAMMRQATQNIASQKAGDVMKRGPAAFLQSLGLDQAGEFGATLLQGTQSAFDHFKTKGLPAGAAKLNASPSSAYANPRGTSGGSYSLPGTVTSPASGTFGNGDRSPATNYNGGMNFKTASDLIPAAGAPDLFHTNNPNGSSIFEFVSSRLRQENQRQKLE